MSSDARFMALALSLARRGLGRVWPNPAVGCVIVQNGRIIGRGWTADGGRPHAEPQALAQAGAGARGATAYVTLEPCSHHGQTPPCATALIAAGIARVVIATGDPDPRVAGRGIALLRAAGITVDLGCLEAQARVDHAGFLSRITKNRPFITLKLALSLDGRIATTTGESQWITGPEARRAVHMLRARHDAVLIGAGTARADDPMLTVRGLGIARQPVRVVVSRGLNLPLNSALAGSARDVPLWLCHAAGADIGPWTALGADCLACEPYDIAQVLTTLATKGITRVFCEGGGSLAASLLTAGLVDELIVFSAGVVIGADGVSGVASMGLTRLVKAPRFSLVSVAPLGIDIMQVWRPI